jgi:hypothetical protein
MTHSLKCGVQSGVSEGEIRKMLARAVRQHRMARRRRIDYVLDCLTNNSS